MATFLATPLIGTAATGSAVVPAASAAASFTVGDAIGLGLSEMTSLQAQSNAKAQQNAAIAQQRADIQQRQYQLDIQEREKRDRLKRQQAAQRARFGAQGIGSSGGSAAALLEGLQKETEKSIADNRNLFNMQLEQNNQASAAKNRINLLQQRQKTFNTVAGKFNLLGDQ